MDFSYYAMDRDNRHERIQIAYDAYTRGIGQHVAQADLIAVCFIFFICNLCSVYIFMVAFWMSQIR